MRNFILLAAMFESVIQAGCSPAVPRVPAGTSHTVAMKSGFQSPAISLIAVVDPDGSAWDKDGVPCERPTPMPGDKVTTEPGKITRWVVLRLDRNVQGAVVGSTDGGKTYSSADQAINASHPDGTIVSIMPGIDLCLLKATFAEGKTGNLTVWCPTSDWQQVIGYETPPPAWMQSVELKTDPPGPMPGSRATMVPPKNLAYDQYLLGSVADRRRYHYSNMVLTRTNTGTYEGYSHTPFSAVGPVFGRSARPIELQIPLHPRQKGTEMLHSVLTADVIYPNLRKTDSLTAKLPDGTTVTLSPPTQFQPESGFRSGPISRRNYRNMAVKFSLQPTGTLSKDWPPSIYCTNYPGPDIHVSTSPALSIGGAAPATEFEVQVPVDATLATVDLVVDLAYDAPALLSKGEFDCPNITKEPLKDSTYGFMVDLPEDVIVDEAMDNRLTFQDETGKSYPNTFLQLPQLGFGVKPGDAHHHFSWKLEARKHYYIEFLGVPVPKE